MGTADTGEAARSEAASRAARARWGAQVVTRAAAIVVERAAELDDTTRAAVEAAVTQEADNEL